MSTKIRMRRGVLDWLSPRQIVVAFYSGASFPWLAYHTRRKSKDLQEIVRQDYLRRVSKRGHR